MISAQKSTTLHAGQDFQDLHPVDKGRYYVLTCPACGKKEAYIYKGSRTLRCNRLNKCGFITQLRRHVPMQYQSDFATIPSKTSDVASVEYGTPPPSAFKKRYRVGSQAQRFAAPARPDLEAPLAQYCELLTDDSPGALYLQWRKISLEVARKRKIGYSPPNRWCHLKDGRPVRQWRHGHLIFPLRNARGELINLQARALDSKGMARQKGLSHDILPGPKGIFNGQIFRRAKTVFLCEGVFDALSLLQIGINNVAATIGAGHIPWRWLRHVKNLVICFDLDAAGEAQYRQVARDAGLSGLTVHRLPSAIYGNKKDLNDALRAGVLSGLALVNFCEANGFRALDDLAKSVSHDRLVQKLIDTLDGEALDIAFTR